MLDNRQTSKPLSNFKLSHNNIVVRSLDSIDSIVLHQMGTEFDITQNQIRINGSLEQAIKVRVAKVKCHFAIIKQYDGFIYNNDISLYVYHANKLNARSIGIEVQGNYPLESSDRVPYELSARALRAITYIVGLCPNVKYIFAHRQADNMRVRCPGQELWRKVAMNTGLEMQPDYSIGDGKPLPRNWYDISIPIDINRTDSQGGTSSPLVPPNRNILIVALIAALLTKG